MDGTTTWLVVATALVLFMTPGLALFYGGMSREKNVLNMLMMSFVCMGIVPLTWVVIGFSFANGPDDVGGLLGGFDWAFWNDVPLLSDSGGTVGFAAFALTFAVITPALVSGAVADRMKFSAYVIWVIVWSILVFAPSFYWVFNGNGWLVERGSIDFAGGTIVHVSAGSAALALILVLGPRKGWPRDVGIPHSLPLTLIGAGILWFGWFGFNAGSATGDPELGGDYAAQVAQSFFNTFIAAATAMVAWLLVEKLRDGHATSLGAASGVVAGLVGITPAAGFVGTWGAILIGAAAGAACYFAIQLKYRFRYDDALDVIGIHMVGGLIGGLLLGFLANPSASGANVLDKAAGFGLFIEQVIANVAVGAWSFFVTIVLALILKATMGGIRVDEESESIGLDRSEHGETAYPANVG